MLAETSPAFPIIIAGNRNAGNEIKQLLKNQHIHLCENVMPAIDKINIEPTRQLIRDIFLDRIVCAKGLDNEVLMPTPAAVLAAAELLAKDLGDLILIDVGGATTDIYSIAEGTPRSAGIIYKGLPEPKAKRTVEGDIGMRYSAGGIVEATGVSKIAGLSGLSEETVISHVKYITDNTGALPNTADMKSLDFALAASAIETATIRHTGSLEEVYTSSGRALVQTGKDLTDVASMVMTGGALLHTDRQQALARYALYSDNYSQSLRPQKANLLVDKHYILAAMGLLSKHAPDLALKIMNAHLHQTL